MNNENETDDFLDALRAGNSSAFEKLYKDNYPIIANLIRNNNGKDEDAQDVFQETLIAFVKNLQKADFELKVKISTYLYAIARRIWLYRLRQHKPTVSLVVDDKSVDIEDVGEEALIEKEQVEEKHKLIARVLKELKEDCQALLLSYYFKKRSLQEIAEKMNYTYAFIKVKKNRCMNAFKKKIEQNSDFKNLNN